MIYVDGLLQGYVGTQNYYSTLLRNILAGPFMERVVPACHDLSHIHRSMALIGGGVFVEDSCTLNLSAPV